MIQNPAGPVSKLSQQFYQMTAQWKGRGFEATKQVCEAMQRHPLLALVIANGLFLAATSRLASCLMNSQQSDTNQSRKKLFGAAVILTGTALLDYTFLRLSGSSLNRLIIVAMAAINFFLLIVLHRDPKTLSHSLLPTPSRRFESETNHSLPLEFSQQPTSPSFSFSGELADSLPDSFPESTASLDLSMELDPKESNFLGQSTSLEEQDHLNIDRLVEAGEQSHPKIVAAGQILKICEELRLTLDNHATQTEIEIAVLEAYMTNNRNLSPLDCELLCSYVELIRHTSEFEADASRTIDEIEKRMGSVEEIIEAYHHIWEGDCYAEYARRVKAIIDCSPNVSELLQNHTKFPGTFKSFGEFVSSLSKNNDTVKALKKRLRPKGQSIDSTITMPKDKNGGAMYMQWLIRVPMLLSSLLSQIQNQGVSSPLLESLVASCEVKVAFVNMSLQVERFEKDLPKINELLQDSQEAEADLKTIEESKVEKARIRKKILQMREILAFLQLWEEVDQNAFPNLSIPSDVNIANVNNLIESLRARISRIEQEVEPEIKEGQLNELGNKLIRIQNLSLQERNNMNLTELKEAIDLINQFLESNLGQIPKNITDQLNATALRAQRDGFNRRRHLFLQHLKKDSIRVLCSSVV